MCLAAKDKSQIRWNLPLGILYLFLFLSFLGANDPQEKILEKIMALEDAFRNLSLKIDDLEKRVSQLEKGLPKKAEKAEKPREMPYAQDVLDMGQGFFALEVGFRGSLNDTIFTGEIENSSTKNYQFMVFNLEVYNEKGEVIGATSSYVMDIPMGSRKPFEVTIYGVNVKDVARYSIKYAKGS
jgi:hypothetical protein